MEDQYGKQWQGKMGQLLQQTYSDLGIDLFEDCLNINAVNCRPTDNNGNNRVPNAKEIACCRTKVLKVIEDNPPKLIILLGNSAVESLIGHRWKKDLGGIGKWRGWTIPDRDFNAWICPTFHPSFVGRSEKEAETIWKMDLQKAFKALKLQQPPVIDEKKQVKIVDHLDTIEIPKLIALDYETTGLKPYAEGHQIVCAAIAISESEAFAFMLTEYNKKTLINILSNPKIQKIAHNIKFEETWSVICLNQPVKGWKWDTMLASHILDNRPDITSLKFQTYVNFGLIDYDNEVMPYLKSKNGKDSNAKNKILELISTKKGREGLLLYNGLDALFEYKLAKKQMRLVEAMTMDSYNLLHEGTLSFARTERAGIHIDVDYCIKKKEVLTRKIIYLQKKLGETRLAKQWKHHFGDKFNLNSNYQLSKILYAVKKITPPKLTFAGKGSTDNASLSELNMPELNLLLEIRKLIKIRDTYLEAYLREQVNGIIHPFFNLHLVRTYRSSSDSPNLQNVPKRDNEAMKICRRAILPSPGYQLVEADYSGLEVRISACYHRDKTMLKYVRTPGSDMHADMTKQIFLLDSFDKKSQAHSLLRYIVKGAFVFAEFYGDYYKNSAINLCKESGLPLQGKWHSRQGVLLSENYYLSEHLINNGISSFPQFQKHMQKIENNFWNVKFKGYQAWKDNSWKDYQEKGYINTLTGFRCSGLMDKKNVSNYPIQGSAFHCLLKAFIEIDKISIKERWKSHLIGQIHDSMLLNVYPDELDHVIDIVREETCEKLPKIWDWIITPLDINIIVYGIDASWSENAITNKERKKNNEPLS